MAFTVYQVWIRSHDLGFSEAEANCFKSGIYHRVRLVELSVEDDVSNASLEYLPSRSLSVFKWFWV